jgi:hypothetical protein
MKTSLILDDRVFEDAKKESHRTGKAISEIISSWASLGRDLWRQKKRKAPKSFKPLNLGEEKIDLSNRKDMKFLMLELLYVYVSTRLNGSGLEMLILRSILFYKLFRFSQNDTFGAPIRTRT